MTDDDDLRRKTDELLQRASTTDNMAERSRLIDEAVRCRALTQPESTQPEATLDEMALDWGEDDPSYWARLPRQGADRLADGRAPSPRRA